VRSIGLYPTGHGLYKSNFPYSTVREAMTEMTPFWMREALSKQTSKEAWETTDFPEK
jgi:hypothetical protein